MELGFLLAEFILPSRTVVLAARTVSLSKGSSK
jgi:hypothetical protein